MELWCPLVTHVSIAAEPQDLTHSGTEHSCMFIYHVYICMVWFVSFIVLYGITVCIYLHILYVLHLLGVHRLCLNRVDGTLSSQLAN